MEYNIENTLLTDREIEVVKQKADDKLIDVLTSLVNESTHTFYGDMRFNSFTNNILNIQNEISNAEELLKSLEVMSYNELRKLGSKYKIKKDPKLKLDKVLLLNEVEKAITLKINDLRNKSNEYANAYTKNYKNTFEYFINDKISKLESAITTEHNLDNLNKYRYLRDNFKVLSNNLKNLHSWIDELSYPATLLIDCKEELNECNKKIKEYQDKIVKSADYNEVMELTNLLKQENDKKHELNESIKIQKQNILSAYNNSNIEINFVNMRNEFLKSMLNITSNCKEAFDNGVLDKNDFITVDSDGKEIDKCSRAFHSFFYEIIEKEFDFRNYLDENEIVLEEDNKSRSSKLFDLVNEKGRIVNYHDSREENLNDDSKDEISEDTLIHDEKKDEELKPEEPVIEEIKDNASITEPALEEIKEDESQIEKDKPEETKSNLEQSTINLSQAFAVEAEEEKNLKNSISSEPEISILGMSSSNPEVHNEVNDEFAPDETKNDDNLRKTFNVVPAERNLSGASVESTEESNPVVETEDVSEQHYDNFNYSFRDVLIAFCNNAGDRMVFKVIDIKDNALDKIVEQKRKAKNALIDTKEKIFKKFRDIYLNDQKKYEEVKHHFMHENIFIKAKEKLEQMKTNIINEYNENHGGRDL